MSSRATRSSKKAREEEAQPPRDAGEGKAQPTRVCFYGKDHYLSNMHQTTFNNSSSGKNYNCVEQYMQAAKAAFFGDEDTLTSIMKVKKPEAQKSLGKTVTPFNEEKWAEVSYSVVLKGVYLKFTTSEKASTLKEQLLATGNAELVEASPNDKIWGVGLSVPAAQKHQGDWPGQNKLGLALMEVRSQLMKEGEAEATKSNTETEKLDRNQNKKSNKTRTRSSKPKDRANQKNAGVTPKPKMKSRDVKEEV